jgi:hypothetical protein
MKMKAYSLIVFTLIILIIVSCDNEFFNQKRIEMQYPPVKPVLVVSAINTTYNGPVVLPSHLTVKLSKLHDLNEPYFSDSIGNATVILKNSNSTDTMHYDPIANHYFLIKKLQNESQYDLMVDCPGYVTVFSKDSLPSEIIANEILIDPKAGFQANGRPFGCATVSFTDQGNSINYYEIVVSLQGAIPISTNDAAVTSESYYPKIPENSNFRPTRLLFSDRSFNGEQKTVAIQFFPNDNDGILSVSLRNVSYNHYRYFTSLLEYRFNRSGDVLMGKSEPKNIFSNIENGIGIFGFYTEFKKEMYIK